MRRRSDLCPFGLSAAARRLTGPCTSSSRVVSDGWPKLLRRETAPRVPPITPLIVSWSSMRVSAARSPRPFLAAIERHYRSELAGYL